MADHTLVFGETPTSDDKTFATIAHLSIFISHFIGPLVVWFIFKEKSAFIRYHALQAVLYQFATLIVATAIGAFATITCGIGAILYILLIPMFFVPVWGAWRAYEGDWSGFPLLSGFGR